MLDRLSDFQKKIALACVFAVTIVVTMFAYMASYEPVPLLEEFFLLDFLHSRSTSMMAFLTSIIDWNGPLPDDSWGMFASGVTASLSIVSNQSIGVIRAVSIFVHALNCTLVFLVARKTLAAPEEGRPAICTWLAIGAALIFALHPLAPEAVSFIGGLAYELGTLFFLGAFYLYVKGKQERNWTILGVAWISFLFAVLSDNSLWSSGFIMVALELAISFIGPPPPATDRQVPTADEVFEDAVDRMLEESKLHQTHTESQASTDTATGAVPNSGSGEPAKPGRVYDEDDDPDNLFETLVPCLPFIVLGVLLSIRSLPATGNEQLPSDMIAGFSDWGRVFKHLFFPINQSITAEDSNAYVQMWCLYAIPLVVSVMALVRNKQFRRNAAFLFVWLIVIIVPHLHTAISDSFFIGSRLAYSALVPTSAIIALCLFSPNYAFAGFPWAENSTTKKISIAVSTILLLVISAANFTRTVKQTTAYNAGAKRLDRLNTEVKKFAAATKSPYVFVRNVPRDIAVSDRISPNNLIVFDSQKKLLRAADIPGGSIKDALREGQYRDLIARWDDQKQLLTHVDLPPTQPAQQPKIRFLPPQIYERARPQVTNPDAVQFDKTTDEILIKSPSGDVPTIGIDATGIPQFGDDFIYIECRLELPNAPPDPEIKMYWLTSNQKELIESEKVHCAITNNDGLFHRYYFPLRSLAWTTNGPISKIYFEFPKASRAVLRDFALVPEVNRMAKLIHIKTEKRPDSQGLPHTAVHSRLTYDYPNLPKLGLVSIDKNREETTLKYDTSMVENAQGALIEISRADTQFARSNPDQESELTFKTIPMDNTVGEIKLPGKHFKFDGVYSIRVFATDKDGKLLGNASDEINILIYTNTPGS